MSLLLNNNFLYKRITVRFRKKIAEMATEICENLDETISTKIQEQLTQFTALSELINTKFFEIKATLDKIEPTQEKISAASDKISAA